MHSIGQGCPTGIVYGLAFRSIDQRVERVEAGSIEDGAYRLPPYFTADASLKRPGFSGGSYL